MRPVCSTLKLCPDKKINPNSLSYKSKFEFADNGALSGTRTLGPLIKSQLLYQPEHFACTQFIGIPNRSSLLLRVKFYHACQQMSTVVITHTINVLPQSSEQPFALCHFLVCGTYLCNLHFFVRLSHVYKLLVAHVYMDSYFVSPSDFHSFKQLAEYNTLAREGGHFKFFRPPTKVIVAFLYFSRNFLFIVNCQNRRCVFLPGNLQFVFCLCDQARQHFL